MEVSGRRVRRFRMRLGRERRAGGDGGSVLPLRTDHGGESTVGGVSCCYCDFKISAFNEPVFRLGRRYAGVLKVWFSMGLGFGLAALILVCAVLLLQFHPNALSDHLAAAAFGLSPTTRFSFSGVAHVFISTVVSVSVHEFGHALAAASEGIQMEYVALFIAAIFPGGLVAFDHDVLQALPRSNALRVYCAGIWHNAMLCGICALTLFLLPLILSPLYMHGESPMVLDVPSASPLFGYLSAGNVIVSLDGIRVHNPKELIQLASLLDTYNNQRSNGSLNLESFGRFHHRKGYCVPKSVIEEGYKIEMMENRFVCPSDFAAFVPMPCLKETSSHETGDKDGQPTRKESAICLDAKQVVKLNKCGDGLVTSENDESGCICSQGEACLRPVQSPGLTWTEITYMSSSSHCLKLGSDILVDPSSSKSLEHDCFGTFVFVGDLIAMAHSIHLSAYQPRWAFSFGTEFPDTLETSLTCTFHVSLALVLLNSLPVYYLDGESILEVGLQYLTLLSPRRRRKGLQICLVGGTILSIVAFFRIFLISSLLLSEPKV